MLKVAQLSDDHCFRLAELSRLAVYYVDRRFTYPQLDLLLVRD